MPEVTFAPSAEDYVPGEDPSMDEAPAVVEAEPAEENAEREPVQEAAPAGQGETSEERARRFGWVPKDEFRGPPGKWRSAADFLEINEQSAPVLKERMRKMEQDAEARFKKLESMTARALEQQRRQLEADYEARILQAKADGDVDEVERLASSRPSAQPEADPDALAFVERNPWFMQDPTLHQIAVGIEQRLVTSKPGMSTADRLTETERQMAALYPDVVKAPAKGAAPRPAPPPINDGVRIAPARKSPVDKLTREERSMGQMMISQGVFKTLDEYAASLDEDVAVIGKAATR